MTLNLEGEWPEIKKNEFSKFHVNLNKTFVTG